MLSLLRTILGAYKTPDCAGFCSLQLLKSSVARGLLHDLVAGLAIGLLSRYQAILSSGQTAVAR
jgi:hypothetical protein